MDRWEGLEREDQVGKGKGEKTEGRSMGRDSQIKRHLKAGMET